MYEAFYNLDGKPFRLTPDAGMLFPRKGHKRAMSYLLYGLEQGEGFVMITGAVGTGKTLLIQKLLEELSTRNIAIASMASANLDDADILPAVAAEFGLPYEGRSKEGLLQDVKRHLTALSDRHTHALLVVDEAQTLTSAALEMLRILSNLECDGHALMQVFLVGQGELRRVMVDNHLEQLRQRIIASYRLDPMEEDECRDYILHRLRAVGWDDDPALAPGIFPAVHRAGRGIPRKINLVMDRLMLYGYLEERHELDEAALATVLGEMREEMGDMPQTLEPEQATLRDAPDAARPGPEPAAGPAAMEHRYNRALLRLLREEALIKRILDGDLPSADEGDRSAQIEDLRRLRAEWSSR